MGHVYLHICIYGDVWDENTLPCLPRLRPDGYEGGSLRTYTTRRYGTAVSKPLSRRQGLALLCFFSLAVRPLSWCRGFHDRGVAVNVVLV